MMDEDFLHLFEESPALRLMRGRLGQFSSGCGDHHGAGAPSAPDGASLRVDRSAR